jgi:hypothetical protein
MGRQAGQALDLRVGFLLVWHPSLVIVVDSELDNLDAFEWCRASGAAPGVARPSATGPWTIHTMSSDSADIATFPWVRNLIGFYVARALVGFDDFRNVARMLDAFLTRPAVVRGLEIPRRP